MSGAVETFSAGSLAALVEAQSARLALNAEAVGSLAARADAYASKGSFERAATWARAAADLAWHNHPGYFVHAPLERALSAIGRSLAAPRDPADQARPPGKRRVLHVVTSTYLGGGHTRLLERWIRLDAASAHSIIATSQVCEEFAPGPREAALASGGEVRFLSTEAGRSLIARAISLRARAQHADVIVSHTHPNDVVPAIALADARLAPSVLLNHADHVFWVGAGAHDLVASLRRSGDALCETRRGIDATRRAILPIPLDLPSEKPRSAKERAALLEELGISSSVTVILTVATGYKYNPICGIDLLSAVEPILASRPDAVLIAVGPSPEGRFAAASARTSGRVRAIGTRRDIERFYAAADIYLDSAPFASLTSLLEAGSHGIPVLSWQPHADAAVLCSDSPGLDEAHRRPQSPEALASELQWLLDDVDGRRSLGERTRTAIARLHGPEGWRGSVEALYERASVVAAGRREASAKTGSPTWCTGAAEPRSEPLNALVLELQRASGRNVTLAGTLKRASRHLPLVPRLGLRARVHLRRAARRLGVTGSEVLTPLDRRLFLR